MPKRNSTISPAHVQYAGLVLTIVNSLVIMVGVFTGKGFEIATALSSVYVAAGGMLLYKPVREAANGPREDKQK